VRAGARRGAPAVLPPDVEFQTFQFNPKDLLLLESRQWDAKQIAAAFGVPAFMLNMDQSGGLNYSNPEMLFATWWRTELYPVARRIESALSIWLPRGNWVEFDPSASLRPDLATMTTTWLQLHAAGIVSDDEVRAAVLDLPPLADGDALKMIDEPPGANASELDAAAAAPPALEVVAS
jgi:HK97 family phage portal protein